MRRFLNLILMGGLSLAVPLGGAAAAEKSSPVKAPLFERHVRPILKAHCFHCHGETAERQGGLDLRLRRLIAAGGDSGAAILPGDPNESYLVHRVEAGEMPPGKEGKKLSAAEIALIRRWIATGAKTARPEPVKIDSGLLITEEDRRFWSFQPVARPTPPAVNDVDRVTTPVDAFVLARLQEQGLSFSPEADRVTLLRRAYFDLIGLPPSPDEIERFLADELPGAYERLIDRLLASPHYGERWGRHWLDVAGYADSEGNSNQDAVRPHAFKYRDYVIRSFNADKPLDEFIREQLAGDEMIAAPRKDLSPEEAEKLIATGFLRMAADGTGSGSNTPLARNQVIADTIQIVSTSLLGLTVGCAQCHHHRYDPIAQDDYYRFRAIFEPALDWKNWRTPAQRRVSLYTDADRRRAKQIDAEAKQIDLRRLKEQAEYIQRTFEKELAKLPEDVRDKVKAARNAPQKKRTKEQRALLKKHPSVNVTAGSLYLYDQKAANELKKIAATAAKLRAGKPKEEFLRALTETPGKIPVTHLFARGDHEQPKQSLDPAGLRVVSLNLGRGSDHPLPTNDPDVSTSGRRLAYAQRITDGAHPLTARVLVNRVWMHHFGRGIVATPGDFGMLGQRPTHPKLLDWLASELVRSGWSLKHLQRVIMTSTAYRQSVKRDAKAEQLDPDHRLLAGMPLRRLEAEVLRDAILTVAGQLNRKVFGPAAPVMSDRVGQFVIGIENLNAGRPGAVIPLHGEELRRSVYVQVRRSRPLAVLDTFDMPAMTPNCESRTKSTAAQQSLMLMNHDFVVKQAELFAQRVRREAGDDVREQVACAWRLAYARPPSAQELNEAEAFVAEQAKQFQPASSKKKKATNGPLLQALASFCQTLLASNEFLYID